MRILMTTWIVLASSVSALAGNIALPTTLDKLLPLGESFVSGGLTFSDFVWAVDPILPGTSASNVTISPYNVAGENGFTVTTAFVLPPNRPVENYLIEWKVTAPKGVLIDDAILTGNPGYPSGSPEQAVVSPQGIGLSELTIIGSGTSYSGIFGRFPFVTSNVSVGGGSVTTFNEGFSVDPMAVPEPATGWLLGIGLLAVIGFTVWRTRR